MTVKKIVAPEKYIGYSTDDKPTKVRDGATFLEYDTGDLYITYNGGTNWTLKTPDTTYIGDIKFGEALPAGTNVIGKVGIDQTTPGTTNAVVEASAAAIKAAVELIDNVVSGSEAQVDVVAALPVGANLIGKVGIDQTTPGTTNAVAVISDTGAYTTPTHTTVNVTITSGAVLAANTSRLYALLVNDSDTTIYLKIGVAAVANQGIRVNANGGSYEMSKKQGNLHTGAINGIHAGTSNKVLLITEGV